MRQEHKLMLHLYCAVLVHIAAHGRAQAQIIMAACTNAAERTGGPLDGAQPIFYGLLQVTEHAGSHR